MAEMHGRIKAVRNALKMTQDEFSSRIGIMRNSLSRIESGDRNPSEPVIRTICREYKVDYDWLKTGEGEMFANADDEALTALDDLMNGEDHEETRALIRALASLDEKQLDVIDVLIERIKKELGN